MAAVMRSGVTVLLMILASFLPRSDASIGLKCNEQCHCETLVKGVVKERRIVCNETGSEPVHLAEEIFLPSSGETISQVYVRVEKSVQVTVTEGFITAWKGYPSSALDVWDVEFLSFPKNLSDLGNWNPLRHTFAGIGIKGCTVDELPRYLFSGKPKVGLRLIQSTVGIVRTDAFSNAKTLNYLEVENSDIGIFKGPTTETTGRLVIANTNSDHGVWFRNSVIGRIESGVFNLTSFAVHEMLLENVTIGRLDADAIVISKINLVLRNSSVADMRPGALRTENSGNVRVRNNHIVAQPGALTHLKCSFSDHHITGNYIDIAFSDAQEPVDSESDEATNKTETSWRPSFASSPYKSSTLYDLATSRLKQVLDPTCVPHNLPRWAIKTACSLKGSPRAERQSSDVLYIVLYSLIGMCVIAVIAAIALSCVLVRSKNRRRRVPDNTPAILMSHINDPLYEEASSFLMQPLGPPPVPSPIQFLPEGKGAACSSYDSGTFGRNGCCSGAQNNSRAENTYITMR